MALILPHKLQVCNVILCILGHDIRTAYSKQQGACKGLPLIMLWLSKESPEDIFLNLIDSTEKASRLIRMLKVKLLHEVSRLHVIYCQYGCDQFQGPRRGS